MRTHLTQGCSPEQIAGHLRRAYAGFTKQLWHVPAPLGKILTYDQGKEMAEHEPLEWRLAIRMFLAEPYSPWQRGRNRNTHGLLRQYRPKGTELPR